MPRREVKCVTKINAPPDKVWSIWMNHGTFPELAEFYKEINWPNSDEKKVGDKLSISGLIPGKKPMSVNPIVTILDGENKKLQWTLKIPCMLEAFHTFTVEADGDGSTFTDEEEVSGCMVLMMKGTFVVMPDCMKSFGEALKKKCEQEYNKQEATSEVV